MSEKWFDNYPVIGKMAPSVAAAKLRELDEAEAAAALERGAEQSRQQTFDKSTWWPFQDKPWQHTAHAYGFLAPTPTGNKFLPLSDVRNIPADETLKNSRIKITLDCLRVAAYPGRGMHHVLFDFYAQNQAKDGTEHLHFNATFRAKEGEGAAVVGYPIFVGLNVGIEGVAFKCFTVNVSNDADEGFLRFLKSDVFKSGLKLATTVQPAIGLFSEMALGITEAIASRHGNVPVQDFYLGLDFSKIPTRARLSEGAYIVVQIPESMQTIWDWEDWVYNPGNGNVANKAEHTELIPYNYLVFSVSRHE